MVDRFNRIVGRGNIELEAWFTARSLPGRSWTVDEATWLFKHRYVGVGAIRASLRGVGNLRRAQPDVLFCLYEEPEYVAVALAARAAGVPVVVHAMKTFDSWRPRRTGREVLKRLIFPRMSGFQVCGPDSAGYVHGYGASWDKITAIAEPVDVERFQTARDERGGRQRTDTLACEFLYVGRLWRGKGLDHLFDAYAAVAGQLPSVTLVLAGDGVDEELYRCRAKSLRGVRFAGFVEGRALCDLYASADALVFPTLGDPYGHVVQEAMAAGLPVISTTAAGDIADRVIHGETGLLVPPADPVKLAEAMLNLAQAPETRTVMGDNGLMRIRGRSIDWWAQQFEHLAEDVSRRGSSSSVATRRAECP